MLRFGEARTAIESEGVNICGWSLGQAVKPERDSGSCITGCLNTQRRILTNYQVQAKVEQVNALIDWEPHEEARLVRKLDLRVLLQCCIT